MEKDKNLQAPTADDASLADRDFVSIEARRSFTTVKHLEGFMDANVAKGAINDNESSPQTVAPCPHFALCVTAQRGFTRLCNRPLNRLQILFPLKIEATKGK
jgi:hypothetical protein